MKHLMDVEGASTYFHSTLWQEVMTEEIEMMEQGYLRRCYFHPRILDLDFRRLQDGVDNVYGVAAEA
jgi:hypothetical protein